MQLVHLECVLEGLRGLVQCPIVVASSRGNAPGADGDPPAGARSAARREELA